MATQYTSEQYEKTAEQRGEPQRASVPAGLPQETQPPQSDSAQRTPLRASQRSDGRRARGPTHSRGVQLARTLGWCSIGLGLAEVMAPRALARLIGVSGEHSMLLRLFGLREMASGVGILTQRQPAPWMWGRVGGDALDLACLGAALTSDEAKPGRIAAAMAAVAGVTALDVLCSQQLSQKAGQEQGRRAEYSVMINRAPADLYQCWRDFRNLPRFMPHLRSVRVDTERHSHWVAHGPAGTTVTWDAEVIDDRPDALIAWRSLAGADVDHAGSVRFEEAPGGRGTFVRVCMVYHPPGGALGAVVAPLFGTDPGQHLHEGLRRFKQLMEAGEMATTSGQPSARIGQGDQ